MQYKEIHVELYYTGIKRQHVINYEIAAHPHSGYDLQKLANQLSFWHAVPLGSSKQIQIMVSIRQNKYESKAKCQYIQKLNRNVQIEH